MKRKFSITKTILLALTLVFMCNLCFNAVNGIKVDCNCDIELVQEKDCEEDFEEKVIEKELEKDKSPILKLSTVYQLKNTKTQKFSKYLSKVNIVHLDIELRPPLS